MNNIIKKYIGKGGFAMALLLMATGGVMTSCSDSTMESINTDKTKVDKLDPNAQLTTSLLQTYGDFSLMDTYRNYITGFDQYFAGGWNVTNYSGSNFFQDDIARLIWDRYYEVSIKNLVDAIHNSEDKANLNAALRIHRVYLLSVISDIYGDIPASEAGLGYIKGISNPKYDTQEELYSWFFKELDACEKQLGTGTDRISGDVTSLGGDVAKWKKYANSLRLRYAMRISDVNPTQAKEEFESALTDAGGYIASAADDAYIKYTALKLTAPTGLENGDYDITLVDGEGIQFPGGTIKVTTEARPSMENTLWEGEFAVTWGTPFDALKDTFLSKVKAGTILRVYVDGKGQGTAATSWWNNILTGKGDPERGDFTVDGPAKWEFELTDLSIQLLTEQQGLLLVGDGYTVKKVTIE